MSLEWRLLATGYSSLSSLSSSTHVEFLALRSAPTFLLSFLRDRAGCTEGQLGTPWARRAGRRVSH